MGAELEKLGVAVEKGDVALGIEHPVAAIGELIGMMTTSASADTVNEGMKHAVKASSIAFFLESNQIDIPSPSGKPQTDSVPPQDAFGDSVVFVSCRRPT